MVEKSKKETLQPLETNQFLSILKELLQDEFVGTVNELGETLIVTLLDHRQYKIAVSEI